MASRVFESILLLFFLHSYVISTHKISSQLSGVHKGDDVNGVHELKKYLTYLGYLSYNNYSSNQTHKNDDIFDSPLELALKEYQKFYNLNVTGALDHSTITKMHEPRCGMPDFYNSKNSPFHIVSYYSFFPDHPKWHKRKLKYAFNRNVKEEAILPLERAMQEWASVTHFKFFRVKNLSDANIRISFLRGNHGDGLPFDGPKPKGGVAHSFPPPDGRVHFDAAQKWSSIGDKTAFDIQTVGLHEMGHALGLGHSFVKQAVMFPTVAPGERKKLHEDDIKGIKALYKLK